MLKKNHFDILAKQLKALADSNRVRIIALLLQGEQTATELNRQVRICQPTLSHHMKVLCDIAIADYSEGCKQATEQGMPLPSFPEFDQIFAQANNQQAN